MEMFWEILKSLLWPIKGIIYFEEQVLQWGLAYLIVYSTQIMAIVITLFGIGLMLHLSHQREYMRRSTFRLGAFMVIVLAFLFNIAFAWVFLILGAVRGTVGRGERVTNYTIETNAGRMHTRRERNYPSLHYRLGRWIYRTIYTYVFPFVANVRLRSVLSRVLALVIILWGVWHIPYDLTH